MRSNGKHKYGCWSHAASLFQNHCSAGDPVNKTRVYCETAFRPAHRFRTGVSLHGHTLHSKETLNFFYPLAKHLRVVDWLVKRAERNYRAAYGKELDLNRAWWTPPLGAHQAWSLETGQIRDRLGMQSLVSLTDHDDIEAPWSLQVLSECHGAPVSVEWTVPYQPTFFHIGVHNLPPQTARETMARLARYTAGTSEAALQSILEGLAANRETLIVFNHPHWDEGGIGGDVHAALARQFARAYGKFLHAFELNGLRPWSENRNIFEMARHFQKPLISGGDRHGIEANTLLNLTNANTFAEFVEEVRSGCSEIFITKQYLEPFPARIWQNVEDVLRPHENHAYGWTRWNDRAFFICEDGVTRSFSHAFEDEPLAMHALTWSLLLARHARACNFFRSVIARREEVAW